MLISVIIPVYNMEKYLVRCINSVLAQSYKDIEIIIVNDGSTDMSYDICENYKVIDSRIKVIHKENGGLSDARNCGLKYAKGEYITFIDSDDAINFNMIETLYKCCINNNSEIAITKLKHVYSDDEINNNIYQNMKEDKVKVLTPENVLIDNMYNENNWEACGKLFSREILKNEEFPIGKLYEDFYLIPRVISKCKLITITDNRYYYYYQNEQGIMGQSKKSMSKDLIEIANSNIEYFLENKPFSSKFNNDICIGFIRHITLILIQIIKQNNIFNNKEYINYYKKTVLKYRNKILFSRAISFKMKCFIFINYLPQKIFKSLFKIVFK